MAIICKNCNNQFEGKFCNNCGQKADTQRFTLHYLWQDVKPLIFKFSNKGILYTSRQLFTRPGHSIREYIEGKRVVHFGPFSLLLAFAALYGFLYHYFKIDPFSDISGDGSLFGDIGPERMNEWISTHFSLVTILALPLYSFSSYIVFRKQGYNLAEHLIINAFLASQRLMVRIITFPLLSYFNGTDYLHAVTDLLLLIDIILMIWSFSQFFSGLKLIRSVLLTILNYLIFFVGFSFFIWVAITIISKILKYL